MSIRLYDITKRYIDDSLRYYICEVYTMHRYSIGTESDTQAESALAKTMLKDMLGRQAQNLMEKDFIMDWKVNMQFSDKITRRDTKIDNLLYGTDDEVEEFIEVAYQMIDRSLHSVRIIKKHLDIYSPV
jgi:hypothetical protein